MSRFKRFTHSLASGYLVLGANIVYTLAQVPLALHYLSKEEFGLWALAMQVSGYLQLIDFGMASSITRFLIDHKDHPEDGIYGSILKTGLLVLAAQGGILIIGGMLVGFLLPGLFAVPVAHERAFQILVAGQCAILGVVFVGRIFTHILSAHQRYDISNYVMLGALTTQLLTMWVCFDRGMGVYSLLLAYGVSVLFSPSLSWFFVIRLRLLPLPGAWGRVNGGMFRRLFSFGREMFLIIAGFQLVNASQVVVISRTLGLEAAAVWSIATKPFLLAQQFVSRLFDFSYSAFSEMIVRGERATLLARFRDLLILSASLAAWAGLAVALCNRDFLALWTKGQVTWPSSSNWLMALLVVAYSTTRCSIGLVGVTKQIGMMKYVYFFEGIAFIVLSFILAPFWGMNGVIVSALVTDLLCSGLFGFWRVKNYFGISTLDVLTWLRWPAVLLLALAAIFGLFFWVGRESNSIFRLGQNAAVALVVGFLGFWQIGLSRHLRAEAAGVMARLRGRLGF